MKGISSMTGGRGLIHCAPLALTSVAPKRGQVQHCLFASSTCGARWGPDQSGPYCLSIMTGEEAYVFVLQTS